MRMLFCLFYLIFTSVAVADVVDYQYCSAHETDCTATAGCYFDGEDCLPCPKKSYCPANSPSKPISCSQGTQGKYTMTNSVGATDSSECYLLASCERYPYDGSFVSCKVHALDNSPGEGVWEDANGTNECSSTNYHLEWDEDDAECYSNTRDCARFSASIANFQISECLDDRCKGAEGTATYSWGKWNVMNCRYRIGEGPGCTCRLRFNDGQNHDIDCFANAMLNPEPATGNVSGVNNSISSVNQSILYDRISNLVGVYQNYIGYVCYGCPAGYTVTEDDLQRVDGYQGEESAKYDACIWYDYNGRAVCNCSIVSKGKYSAGCLWTDATIHYLGWQDCDASYCPAGQTTDSVGSTSVDACHYTTDTQFCDARGCFSLSDIQNWTPVP